MTTTQQRDLLARVLPPAVLDVFAEVVAPRLAPTPLERSEGLGCWLKRDDQAPFSTHKSRGLGLEVALAVSEGTRAVVISSSGNAAIALGGWAGALGIPGLAFLSHKTATAKIEAVVATGVTTVVTEKPKNFARYAARYGHLADLVPSRHPHGATGYRALAVELVTQLGRVPSDVLLFINSGLTLVGLFEGFRALRAHGLTSRLPALHAVQCTDSPELASALGAEARLEEKPDAGSLGAHSPAPLEPVVEAITESAGGLWMIRNDELRATTDHLAALGVMAAGESMAALAGLERARAAGILGDAPVVLIAAPRRRAERDRHAVLADTERLAEYAEVRALVDRLMGPNGRPIRG